MLKCGVNMAQVGKEAGSVVLRRKIDQIKPPSFQTLVSFSMVITDQVGCVESRMYIYFCHQSNL